MNRTQLSFDEQIKIAGLMDSYRKIHEDINTVEEKLNKLIDKQTKLSENLDGVRGEEKEFGEYLKQKYGPGKLDTTTLEYITE
jgi:septation ring formation regulator EzrA